jgi:hypothetical protein
MDRPGKCADAELHPEALKPVAAQGLRHLIALGPDTIHPVLTDHGRQVTHRTRAQ